MQDFIEDKLQHLELGDKSEVVACDGEFMAGEFEVALAVDDPTRVHLLLSTRHSWSHATLTVAVEGEVVNHDLLPPPRADNDN